MMLPSQALTSARQSRAEVRAAAASEVEQAWASFDPDSMPSISLRPYEKAFAEVQKRNIGTFVELVAIEQQFDLPTHTLSKYLEWKKKLPALLPADSKTKAEMMAAKRARDGQASAAASKKQAADDAGLKAKAAEAIAKRYKDSLDEMMLEAVKDVLQEAVSRDIPIEAACKRVCVARRPIQFFSVFTPHRFLLLLSTNMATNTIIPYAIVL